MGILKLIVQTHKCSSIGAKFRQTWIDKHPDYEYRFVNDEGSLDFFEKHYPSLLETYNKLPMAVQKSDLFRYAYIYHYGGTYADVDTICFAPLHSYIEMDKEQLVVGLEMNPFNFKYGIDKYPIYYCSPFQLLQWTFSASPKHPALAVMLDKINYMVGLHTEDQLRHASRSQRFTLELTGPMMFTSVITDFLSKTRRGNITVLSQLNWGYNRWFNREELDLPNPDIKVQHLFEGSWKR